jgi:hypothetical protein
MTQAADRVEQVLLQREPCVVGADRNAHSMNYIGVHG